LVRLTCKTWVPAGLLLGVARGWCALAIALGFTSVASAQRSVFVPDPGLEAAIRAALDKPTGALQESDLLGLISLSAANRNIASLVGLEAATNLVSLRLSQNRINDLSPLKSLNQLVQVDLDNNLASDLTPLAGLFRLQTLELSWNHLSGPGPLSNLTNLSSLALRGNSLTDVQFVANLGGLTYLNLDENQLQDLTPLRLLSRLTYLSLTQNPATNWWTLSNLTSLANLELRGNGIQDIGFASTLTHLRFLDLAHNQISNTQSLRKLAELSNLVLGGNPTIDPAGLVGLTNLNALWLFSCGLTNLNFAGGMTQLHYLDVAENGIRDVGLLSGLTNLVGLALSGNPTDSLDSLKYLTGISTLALDELPIGDGATLSRLSGLKNLSLRRCALRDLGPLTGLANLNSLYLTRNLLTNIDALTNFSELVRVDLTENLLDTNATSSAMALVTGLRLRGVDVTYNPQNQPPGAAVLSRWFIPANSTADLLFFVSDDLSPDTELSVTASASVPALFSGVSVIAGTDFSRVLRVIPSVNQTGTSRIDLTITEDGTGLTTVVPVDVTVLFPTNIDIPDPRLSGALLGALGRTNGDLTSVDLLAVTNLYIEDPDFVNLTGLEWASNLTALTLDGSSVFDLSPLSYLWQLTFFSASENYIEDLSPLTGLTNLVHLDLANNAPTNCAAVLPHLNRLSSLVLASDGINDLGFIQDLVNLNSLDLTDNHVTDLSPLSGLTNLEFLALSQNLVRTVSPLTNVWGLNFLDVSFNLLDTNSDSASAGLIGQWRSQGAFIQELPQRQLSFVDLPAVWFVSFSSTASLTFSTEDNAPSGSTQGVLVKSSNITLVPSSGLALSNDSSGLWSLTLTPTTGQTGETKVSLVLTNDVGLTAQALVDVKVIVPQAVALTDLNLKMGILSAVGKTAGEVTTLDLLGLTTLNLSGLEISNLVGLGLATNLTSLSLDDNWVSDLAVLGKLHSLEFLSLSNNLIEDITPLVSLTNLTTLNLGLNPITNYPQLATGFHGLTTLTLGQSFLSEVSFLTNLSGLRILDLNNNRLVNLVPLGALTNLSELNLQHNLASDLEPLLQLPSLAWLDVTMNRLNLDPGGLNAPQITHLQVAQTTVLYFPQRAAPVFQVRSSWTVPSEGGSALFFNLLENGVNIDGSITIVARSSDTNLVPNDHLQLTPEQTSDWVLRLTPIPGQTGNLVITLAATNDAGLGTIAPILLSLQPSRPVTDLFPTVHLDTGGDQQWFSFTNASFGGAPFIQSGGISSGEDSWLEATLVGPGVLSYWWKVSSETNYDFLQFESSEGTNAISGEVDWQFQLLAVPAGVQNVIWRFTKDLGCCADGQDAGWVAGLNFQAGAWLDISERPTDGKCRLLLHGSLSRFYEIQASSDLSTWTVLGKVYITNAPTLFIDGAASNRFRGYRLLDLGQ
jgi:Leucine-rich repeat (LRR) protein